MTRVARADRPFEQAYLSVSVAGLFPAGVVAAELRGTADPATLLPAEARCCAGFSVKRTNDFAAGRACARRALQEYGFAASPLERDEDRRPRWPDGLIGSISHTKDFCAAVVTPRASFASLGFDAERIGGVTEDLWAGLFTPSETLCLASLGADERAIAATVLFSAKEAYYKCYFGVMANWLDFTEVTVTFASLLTRAGKLEIRASAAAHATAAVQTGRFAVDDDLVMTGVALPA